MCHLVQDNDSNDDIGSDEGVVIDDNRSKTAQFLGVTHVDGREVMNITGVANQMALESDDIDTI